MPSNEKNGDRKKTWRLFSVALLFAILAGVGAMLYLKILEKRLEARLSPEEKKMVEVVVASKDLAVGNRVDSSTVAVRKVPAEYVNADVITPDQFKAIEGALLTKPLGHGKMLSEDYINLNLPKNFSDTIQLGHRAVTIQVDEVNSIAGLVRPGDSIDLYTRIQTGNMPSLAAEGAGEVIVPVLEDVLILATDHRAARANEDEFKNQSADSQRQAYDTFTLEVTPKEAALISLAESRGSLLTTLKNAKDKNGVLFSKVSLADLVANSGQLLQEALNKQQGRSADGIHLDENGRLVTKDGTIITDPNVHLTKDGLLVTKDGVVLSGRDLEVGADGKIRTRDGKVIDTDRLTAGKDGTLVDGNGTVVKGNGYTSVQGGFLVDKDGHVLTHNGEIIDGVTVGRDGKVRTKDGQVLNAGDIIVGRDGKVSIKPAAETFAVDPDGTIRTADGNPVKAADLVTVGPDGVVRTKDGTVLQGVTVGKDGELYDADGKKLSAAEVMLASQGYTAGKDGTVVGRDGKVYQAKDLVTVDKDGTVRTKDGAVIAGAYVDKDGNLRNKDGSLLTAQNVVENGAVAKIAAAEEGKAVDLVTLGPDGVVRTKDGTVLTGVTVGKDGELYGADGKKLSAADVMLASQGYAAGKDGAVVGRDGKVYQAKDLVTVDKDGTVRTKDGAVIPGAYVDNDGNLRRADGSLLTAQDVVEDAAIVRNGTNGASSPLAGVTGRYDPAFAKAIGQAAPAAGPGGYLPYEVEYIVGGGSDGTAKTFRVQVEEGDAPRPQVIK